MTFDRMYFQGKSCAVTGAASGIGLALCEELLQSGAAKVTLADYNADNLHQHVERLSGEYPGRVQGELCNVTIEEEVVQMVKSAAAFGGGRLDLLINCAGAAFVSKFCDMGDQQAGGSFLEQVATNEDWKRAFSLNYYGAVYGCRAAIPMMAEQGGGQIINIISGIAFSPMAYQSMYAATKAALATFSLCLRAEYADYNVKITPATPGTTATAIFKDTGTPPEAQSPHVSAQRILRGAVANDRVIFGDDGDYDGAKTCFFPDKFGLLSDDVFLGFARQRRSGVLSFVPQEVKDYGPYEPLPAAIHKGDPISKELMQAYIEHRECGSLDRAYYRDKTAVVTGGASGVGLALCTLLLECGAKKVVMADYHRENLAARESELNARFPERIKGIFCDVSKEDSVIAMTTEAIRYFEGRLDLIINCAGIGQMGRFVELPSSVSLGEETSMKVERQEDWERIFNVNFYGPVYGCRAALPIMKRQGGGQIINIISGTAFSTMPFQSIYASSKAALNLLTLTLRYEYWDDNILVNSATPGTTATPIFGDAGVPANAQTPERSALRILTGAARNERLILGDDDDVMGAINALNPLAAPAMDEFLNGVAQSRRAGKVSDYGI